MQPLNCAPHILPCRALIASRPLLALQGGGCSLRFTGAPTSAAVARAPLATNGLSDLCAQRGSSLTSSPQRYLAQTTVDGELQAEA